MNAALSSGLTERLVKHRISNVFVIPAARSAGVPMSANVPASWPCWITGPMIAGMFSFSLIDSSPSGSP